MLDLKKLASVASTDRSTRVQVNDSLSKEVKRKKIIADALSRRKNSYKKFKVTDSFKALKKKIKDALDETESTEDAVDAVLEILNDPDSTPDQTLAATVEVLAEAVDVLQDKLPEVTDGEEPDLDGGSDDPNNTGDDPDGGSSSGLGDSKKSRKFSSKKIDDSLKVGDQISIDDSWCTVSKITPSEDGKTVVVDCTNDNGDTVSKQFSKEDFDALALV